MDKTVILDVFDFVSFHICKHLLNKGFEVHGVHFEEFANQANLDEKRMEIGRNANFFEDSFQKWDPKNREHYQAKQTFIFSIYDLFMVQKDSILLKEAITKRIIQYIAAHKDHVNLVLLLPIQFHRFKEEKMSASIIEQANELAGNVQLFYLPAIYGPWQPSTFMFQQTILAKFGRSDILQSEREWTKDILFVEDAIDAIYEIMESGKQGSYLLESGTENYWDQCAEYLNLDKNLLKNNRDELQEMSSSLVRVTVKKLTPISTSLIEQIEHTERQYKPHL
jgi:hypothetical protein